MLHSGPSMICHKLFQPSDTMHLAGFVIICPRSYTMCPSELYVISFCQKWRNCNMVIGTQIIFGYYVIFCGDYCWGGSYSLVVCKLWFSCTFWIIFHILMRIRLIWKLFFLAFKTHIRVRLNCVVYVWLEFWFSGYWKRIIYLLLIYFL